MGGDKRLGDGGGDVAVGGETETGGFLRGFIILEEIGRETWTEFLGCRKVLPVVEVEVAAVVGFVEADSGCFPFDFDEIEIKFGDVGGPFGYHAKYKQPLRQKEGVQLTCNMDLNKG
jgi:hypothetical protein